MMKSVFSRLARLCCLLIFTAVMAACSFGDDERKNVYRQAETVAKLEAPEDLEQPTQSKAMDIPENLDSGAIPENLELPPSLEGFVLKEEDEDDKEKAEKAKAKEKTEIVSEITFGSDNTQALLVKAPIDEVWLLVENALKKIGFDVDDSNRGKNYYAISRTIEKAKVEDLRKAPEVEFETPKEQYLVYVEPADEATKITIRNMQGDIEGSSIANSTLLQIKGYMRSP